MREWNVCEVGGCEAPRQAQKRSCTHLRSPRSLLEHLPRVLGQVPVASWRWKPRLESVRGVDSERKREWTTRTHLRNIFGAPTSALRPAWLAIAISVETCRGNFNDREIQRGCSKHTTMGYQSTRNHLRKTARNRRTSPPSRSGGRSRPEPPPGAEQRHRAIVREQVYIQECSSSQKVLGWRPQHSPHSLFSNARWSKKFRGCRSWPFWAGVLPAFGRGLSRFWARPRGRGGLLGAG